MQKIRLAVFQDDRFDLLDSLQREGVLHLENLGEVPADSEELADLLPAVPGDLRTLEQTLTSLDEAIRQTKPFTDRTGGLTAMLQPRLALTEEEWSGARPDEEADGLLKAWQQIESPLSEIASQRERLVHQREILTPWRALDTPLEGLGESRDVTFLAGILPDHEMGEQCLEQIQCEGAECQVISKIENLNYIVVAVPKENKQTVMDCLSEGDFEPAGFEGLRGRPADLLDRIEAELCELDRKKAELESEARQFASNRNRLGLLYDRCESALTRRQAEQKALTTKTVHVIEGWARRRDMKRIRKLIDRFDGVDLYEIEPEPGEVPPIDLNNNRFVRPFEVITSLYGMPGRSDADPTPLLAAWFAFFFGLCLTDAGYGLCLVILAGLFLRKMQGDTRLIKLILIGGIATVVVSAPFSWFAVDTYKLPGLGFLEDLPFNPVKNSMQFFVLAIGLGFAQVMFGHVCGLVTAALNRDWMGVVFDHLDWMVFLLSVIGLFVLQGTWKQVAAVALILSALAILLLSARQGGWGARLGMGFYNVFSSIFYLGDVLSYLRLMALGMVTGGIGMAVNMIAGMLWSGGIVGQVFAVVVLVCGHSFNLAMSSLGAFVHTLRLQYVEFFPKFFSGGGQPFQPLERSMRYTLVK